MRAHAQSKWRVSSWLLKTLYNANSFIHHWRQSLWPCSRRGNCFIYIALYNILNLRLTDIVLWELTVRIEDWGRTSGTMHQRLYRDWYPSTSWTSLVKISKPKAHTWWLLHFTILIFDSWIWGQDTGRYIYGKVPHYLWLWKRASWVRRSCVEKDSTKKMKR